MRLPLVPLAIAVGTVACAATAPALGATFLAGGNGATMAADTNAEGAVSWFDWETSPTQTSNVISRDGRFAYATVSGTDGVLQYARNPDTGALSPLSPVVAPYPAGRQIRMLALAPDGSRLFATDDSDRVFSYPVGSDGLLGTRSVDSDIFAPAFRMTPDGRTAYSTLNQSAVATIQLWDVGTDGVLTAKSSPNTYAQGVLGSCVAIAPDGRNLYVPTEDLLTARPHPVTRWTIDPATGLLTRVSPLPQISTGYDFGCEAAVTPDGRTLVVAYRDQLRVWPIEPDGSLGTQGTPLTWAASGTWTSGLALHPSGIAAYVTARNTNDPAQPGGLAQARLSAGGASILPQATSIPWQDVSWNDISVAPARPPIAAVAEALGRPGVATRLDASASRDPDTAIARYDWEFGDGTSARDAGPRPEHVYVRVGEYTARVTVTNTAGCSTDPVGLYNGRMTSCIGGASATATARVRVAVEPPAAHAGGGSASAGGGTAAKPRALPARFVLRGGVGRTAGSLPAGATRVTQSARRGGSSATQNFVEMARAKSARGTCRVKKRAYTCRITLTRGAWTLTTRALGPTGVVAQGTRRVVVR